MSEGNGDETVAPRPPHASSRNRGWAGATIDIYKGADAHTSEWPAAPDLWVRSHEERHHTQWHEEGPVIVLAHLPATLLEQAAVTPQALIAAPSPPHENDVFVADICRLMAAEVESPPHPAQTTIWGSLSTALGAYLAHRFGRRKAGLTAVALFNGAAPSGAASLGNERSGGLALWQEQRARELLARQVGGHASIGEVAAACELSRTHFSRAFKVSTGQTPHQWLTSLRIERAKRHLLQSDLSLTEIATDCGFSDQSHFTRVFTTWTGASPRNWQRRHQT